MNAESKKLDAVPELKREVWRDWVRVGNNYYNPDFVSEVSVGPDGRVLTVVLGNNRQRTIYVN